MDVRGAVAHPVPMKGPTARLVRSVPVGQADDNGRSICGMSDSVVMAHLVKDDERAAEIIRGVGEVIGSDFSNYAEGAVFKGGDYEELHAYIVGVFAAQGDDWREHWSVPHRNDDPAG